MAKVTFYGKIADGKMVLDDRNLMVEYIKTCKDMDIELTIGPQSADPSVRQWGYLYSSVYKEFALCFGWTISDVDEEFKKRFMKENLIVLPEGMTLTKTVFDKVWLAKFVDSCIRYCADEGVTVAPPKIDFNKESK